MSVNPMICLKSQDARKCFLQEMGRNEHSFEKDIDTIVDWLKTQKHLPEITNRNRIAMFLVMNKCSVEIVKKKIDMYYSVRKLIPEFYENRHPRLPRMQAVRKALYLITLPKLTHEGHRVTIFKLRDREAVGDLNFSDMLAYAAHIAEIRLAEDECVSNIFLCDIGGLILSDLLKVSLPALKKMAFVAQEVFSNRVLSINYINCALIEPLLRLLKGSLNPKLLNRIHVHNDVSSLLDQIPQEILPKDFGGHEVSLEELNDLWEVKLTEYYDRFDELDRMEINEAERPDILKNDDRLGFHGNFKKLDVD